MIVLLVFFLHTSPCCCTVMYEINNIIIYKEIVLLGRDGRHKGPSSSRHVLESSAVCVDPRHGLQRGASPPGGECGRETVASGDRTARQSEFDARVHCGILQRLLEGASSSRCKELYQGEQEGI